MVYATCSLLEDENNHNMTELQKYYSFLRKIDYKHNNSKAYFSHPLRVACSSYYLASNRKKVFETIKLALFHNIVETTNIRKNFLENYLGKKITKQSTNLYIHCIIRGYCGLFN